MFSLRDGRHTNIGFTKTSELGIVHCSVRLQLKEKSLLSAGILDGGENEEKQLVTFDTVCIQTSGITNSPQPADLKDSIKALKERTAVGPELWNLFPVHNQHAESGGN